jgi:hypothetical protein
LPLKKLWDPSVGGGLLANAVQLPGCSGSFVSSNGLLVTNHHCVVGILQEHSSPEANLVKDGFVARTREEEKAAKAFRVQVPRRFVEVTNEVLSSIPEGADDLARYKAVEAKFKALVAACEQQRNTRCTMASFDGGLRFSLTEFSEFSDVRLVYAPPESVGNFGGESDNWTWPRHTGDFSLLRVYVDGKPYQPTYWFPVSTKGVKPLDSVAVLGYPGTSYRSWLAEEMLERREMYFPALKALTSEWIRIMQVEGEKRSESAIAVADNLRSLLNSKKNAEGQLAGMARGSIIEKQRATDEAVRSWALKRLDQRAALEAYDGLIALTAEKKKTWERDFLLDALSLGPRALSWPLTLVRKSTEFSKSDEEREPGFQQRDMARMQERLERDQKRLSPTVDFELTRSWVEKSQQLGSDQRLASIDRLVGTAVGNARVDLLTKLIGSSKVLNVVERMKMFNETPEQLKARKDPLIDLAFELDAERRELRDRRNRWSGATLRLRPTWRRAVQSMNGKPMAPDANSTLRVTFGKVVGYSPRDGLMATPQTTLSGVMAKHTGEGEYNVPAHIRDAVAERRFGRWVDSALKDVPVNFLSDCDTTGGNSGSPTIDASGRLVGVNFDRVWENVANDFGYNPSVARNVNADIRYLLWLLEEVAKAPSLVREMTGS